MRWLTIRGRSRSLDKLLMQLHSTSLQLLTPLRKLLPPRVGTRVGTLLLPMLGVPQLTPPQDVSRQDVSRQRACWSVRELL